MSPRVFVGSIIVGLLLLLYVASVIFAINIARCVAHTCGTLSIKDFHEGWSTAFTTVGGLVSALVISELALTKRKTMPSMQIAGAVAAIDPGKLVKLLSVAYVGVWLVAGLSAFIAGNLAYYNVFPLLTDMGKSWFGLAIAAAYAYFAIEP